MIKLFAKKSRLIAASSAFLFATAFQAGGCTVNIDENLLNQLSGLLGNFSFQGQFEGGQMQGEFEGHDEFDEHDQFSDDNGGSSSSSGSE